MHKTPKQSRQHKTPSVRIIGGEWRGRRIAFHPADGLRPTGDRMREMVFNWLQHDVRGARCLDLYAGSGAMGFEAASRGAREVVLVEKNFQCARQLEISRRQLQSESVQVHNTTASQFLAQAEGEFDIAFIDPPFEGAEFGDICTQLEHAGVLAGSALVYVETPRGRDFAAPPGWHLHRQRTLAAVEARLFRRAPTEVSFAPGVD